MLLRSSRRFCTRFFATRRSHEAPSSSAISNLETEDPLNPVAANPSLHLVRSFLRLANLPNSVLSRYEAALWRQVRQTLVILDALERASHGGRFRMLDNKRRLLSDMS